MIKSEIPISDRARKYGYVIWPKVLDSQVKTFFDGSSKVNVIFEGADLGQKNIDWAHRRISLGYRWTRRLPVSMNYFILTWKGDDTIKVVCR